MERAPCGTNRHGALFGSGFAFPWGEKQGVAFVPWGEKQPVWSERAALLPFPARRREECFLLVRRAGAADVFIQVGKLFLREEVSAHKTVKHPRLLAVRVTCSGRAALVLAR